MRYLTLLAVVQYVITACDDPHDRSPQFEVEYPHQMQDADVSDHLLCIDLTGDDEVHYGLCDGRLVDQVVVATEQQPFTLQLYGSEGVEYCLGVLRLSGYITISHEHGVVHRDGSQFTWCVTPLDSSYPEVALIRSFTTSALSRVSVW